MRIINKNILKPKATHIVIICFAFATFFSCSNNDKKIAEVKEEPKTIDLKEVSLTKQQALASDITTSVLQTKNLSELLKVNGKLDVPPQNLVSISAPINGFLKSTEMLEGTHVHKGQVVAVIEHPDIVQLELDFIEAKNKYDVLDKEIIRQQELNKENVNTTKILQQTQGDFNIAKAKYKALEERLRMAGINKTNLLSGNVSGVINIVSPINGFVTKINVNIGKMVNQQDVMFEIVDTEHLHAELTVFEKDITKIKEGQLVRFNLANNPEKELTATVHLIGRSLDNTRSIRIHCHLDKEDKDLLPGMFINAVIELTGANVKCINVDAVVKSDGSEFIFIKKNKTDLNFIKIEVKTGISDGKFTEIKPFEPIENTDEIVISGAFYLLSKIKMSSVEDACEN